jgi:anaerobic magnesium-protoporphyrin IX monomethyl ester cyclase
VVETRLDRVNEELLRKMKAAGCRRIHYGLESGDPKLFSRVGKDGAEGRMETLIRNFQMTEKLGIHPHMFVLIGLMGESWQTVERTIATIRRIKPLTLQVAIVTPYPGTTLFEEAKSKGLLSTEDWSQYTGFIAVSRTEELSSEDLKEARQRILQAHRKATAWKKRRYLARLAWRYFRDGTLWGRLARKARRAGQ